MKKTRLPSAKKDFKNKNYFTNNCIFNEFYYININTKCFVNYFKYLCLYSYKFVVKQYFEKFRPKKITGGTTWKICVLTWNICVKTFIPSKSDLLRSSFKAILKTLSNLNINLGNAFKRISLNSCPIKIDLRNP